MPGHRELTGPRFRVQLGVFHRKSIEQLRVRHTGEPFCDRAVATKQKRATYVEAGRVLAAEMSCSHHERIALPVAPGITAEAAQPFRWRRTVQADDT